MPIALKSLNILPAERTALMLGFAFHFCVLASYYLVRPLRDALGLEGGADQLQWLFSATFVVMLLMVPLYGALVSRLPATRFVPLIYRLIALSMLVFGLLIANHVAPVTVGQVFFVWTAFTTCSSSRSSGACWSTVFPVIRGGGYSVLLRPVAPWAPLSGRCWPRPWPCAWARWP